MRAFAWVSAVVIIASGCSDEVHVQRGDGDVASDTRPEASSPQVNPPPESVSPRPPEAMVQSTQNKRAINTRYLLSRTGAVLVVHPDRLLNAEIVQKLRGLYPGDPAVHLGEQLGFDLNRVDQMIFASYPDTASFGAMIARFHQEYDKQRLRNSKSWKGFDHENSREGWSYWTQGETKRINGEIEPRSIERALCLVDDKTIIAGMESMVVRMMESKGERSPLIDTLGTMTNESAVIWVSNGIVSSELFAGLFAEPSPRILLMQLFGGGDENTLRDERFSRIPKPLRGLGEVLEQEESVVAFTFDADPTIELHAKLFVDPAIGNKAESESRNALRFASGLLKENRKLLASLIDLPANSAEFGALQAVLESPVERPAPNIVRVDLHGSQALDSLVVTSATRAALRARDSARASESRYHLRQIILGLHNYHENAGHFPPVGNCDKAGNLLLSWRVHILPQIGEDELYKEFHLDEPWDSEHNRSLIPRIPKIYQLPGRKIDGKTHYLGVAGNGGLFAHPTGARWRDIADGTVETIAIVCVSEETAVPWTKPADYEFDPDQPAKGIGIHFRDRYDVAMVDGSVRALEPTTDAEILRAMFTIAGFD